MCRGCLGLVWVSWQAGGWVQSCTHTPHAALTLYSNLAVATPMPSQHSLKAKAQCNLGSMYANGFGVDKDQTEAAAW